MPAERLLVVPGAHRGRLGCAESVIAEEVGQGAVVDGDGLGDLEEPDQLKPVQPMGARVSSAWTSGCWG